MALTFTATAMSRVSRNMPSGTIARSVRWVMPAGSVASASANATIVQFCRLPNQSSLVYLSEAHSSSAATCLADIGIKDQVLSLSAFMSQVTAGQNNVAGAQKLPYVVSITDTQATQYAYLVGAFTSGTNAPTMKATINAIYTMDKD
jgi:hypothetical protein